MVQIRPPVVTILGHVDHGKTTLLDFIRKSSVAAKEHGGITQHIGAYQINVQATGTRQQESRNSKPSPDACNLITFIDTPGHAAFEKMRSRGADAADVAVLVVAVNDGIMAQTIEAINHIKRSGAKMIVAVNKVDLPGIDVKVQMEKIKKQLSDREILVEEYGGDVPIVQLSAKTGEGVDKLIEIIQLVAEVNEFKGDPDAKVEGVVIESSLDKFKGAVATLLIRNGTLKKGQEIVIGGIKGKVRGMLDSLGKSMDLAGPSTPVEILGLEAVPTVGSILGQEKTVEQVKAQAASLLDKLTEDKLKVLKVVVKADKQGSLEAIEHSLEKFNAQEKLLDVLSAGVGEIGEGDIKMASATKAIVVGFNVKMTPTATKMAETDQVLVRMYNIIYEMLEELEDVVEGMLRPGQIEEVNGRAEIIAQFPHGKLEKIAGCRVLEGSIAKGQRIRVKRGEEVLGETKLASLKKVKEEVNKVEKGNECGMLFNPPIEFQTGDFVESFRTFS